MDDFIGIGFGKGPGVSVQGPVVVNADNHCGGGVEMHETLTENVWKPQTTRTSCVCLAYALSAFACLYVHVCAHQSAAQVQIGNAWQQE